MQYTTVLMALFATITAAQNTTIPACAQVCFDDNLEVSGCESITDYACLCTYVSECLLPPLFGEIYLSMLDNSGLTG